ncbi:uncharacterized protein LOC105249610 isoform X4 [Camponotus floridanus]|uniref:uncharacterized protein LOC105249610 isoform X4 n=1 Tax=Camponotus floridanus TaxID=104421 RepID=UPI000DC6A1A5|nr:uncharacterized protein LOC105249610 isoform X4 [Camponotus floridanus]
MVSRLFSGSKKFYDCNERIILSAIAFLTLPETLKELHKRLPAMIMPSLPPKPKPPVCLVRQKNSCPYKEELFKRPDWVSYRNALQKWQKQYKLLIIPKIILFKQHNQFFINDEILSEIRKQRKDICTNYLEKTSTKDLQKSSSTKFDAKDTMNIEEITYEDENFSKQENLKTGKSSPNIYGMLEDSKKFDFIVDKLTGKPGTMEYKICGPKLPGGNQKKSWLGEKNAHYIIAGASLQDKSPSSCPVTYEITGMANVTPSNSDEKFFAMLNLDDKPKKIFPTGRENLSRKWQDWLQNADEDFKQMEEKADELMKSIQTTMKLVFPGPVCDSCCSCRQTRKTDEKLQQSRTPIDNRVQNNEKNKYVTRSMTMHSPEPTTGSPINLTALQNEIKTNIIINGVTKENNQTQYYISGIQRDNMHVLSQISDFTASQLVRNVPSCSCAIKRMTKDVNSSISEDDIPWTKDTRLCIGKKYRPYEIGAYSCKTYPDDKSCRHNPFMKEIIRMERDKREKEKRKAEKEKAESVEVEIQAATKIEEKKKDKFTPNRDYCAYDDPWNILRTAPSKIIETDYEKTLKLTSPALPVTSSLNMQKREKDISFLQELKKVEDNSLHKENNEEMSEISLELSKKLKEKNTKKRERKNMEKKKEWIPKKVTVTKNSSNFSSKISKSICGTKKKQRTKLSLLFHKPVKQSNKIDKLSKYGFIKKDKKNVMDETKQLDNRKQEMARLKNMFKSFAILDNIQPAILPEELLATSRRDPKEIMVDSSVDEESRVISKEPYGWRTKSEQELPAKKTLTYLCEPDYPLETIAVRPGGRPCQCRENRNKKKILMYNVSGLVEKKKDGRGTKKTKMEEENRIIDGVLYFTPPVSPRRSDEYIPEYDLLESPYDMCINDVTDERLKLIERYSGPKSLIKKIQKKSKSCNCSNGIKEENHFIHQKKNIAETRRKLIESKLPEERWKIALKDAALMDYFTQHKNNAPCWTPCKKFARNSRPRKLKVVKPVCECKYERKIVERDEERTKWSTRQKRLKTLKKQPFMYIVDISRPMIEDTKFIISGVKTLSQEDNKENIKYCISDVAENVSMLSLPQQIIDGLKMSTPFQTPEPSREDILQAVAPHRHWSPTNISPGPLPRKDTALKKEIERRKKARDEAFRLIYGDNNEQDISCLHHSYQEVCDEKKLMLCHEMKENHMNVEDKTPKKIIESQSPSKKINKIKHRKDISHTNVTNEVFYEKKKYLEEATDEIAQQDVSYKQIIDKTDKKIDDEMHLINDNKKHMDSKIDFMAIIKAELKKMAAEGYIFAKLPKCYLMPQLQDWIMYRQCVTFSETDKKNLMQATVRMWQLLEMTKMPKIEKPSLHMTKYQLKRLTYNQAEEIKKKIQEARAIFHSKIRKMRVSYARTMWSTMEFGKFPSTSFKRAFFTYMASKEADGYVYKPWMPSEVRELKRI